MSRKNHNKTNISTKKSKSESNLVSKLLPFWSRLTQNSKTSSARYIVNLKEHSGGDFTYCQKTKKWINNTKSNQPETEEPKLPPARKSPSLIKPLSKPVEPLLISTSDKNNLFNRYVSAGSEFGYEDSNDITKGVTMDFEFKNDEKPLKKNGTIELNPENDKEKGGTLEKIKDDTVNETTVNKKIVKEIQENKDKKGIKANEVEEIKKEITKVKEMQEKIISMMETAVFDLADVKRIVCEKRPNPLSTINIDSAGNCLLLQRRRESSTTPFDFPKLFFIMPLIVCLAAIICRSDLFKDSSGVHWIDSIQLLLNRILFALDGNRFT